ncbi:MAG: gfo/Idh/MocA family oxidoreductase [Planctomycetota bacterium]|nr:MAG: gfo/Idh/MocA family oxidoreductase [Planctomycetota bacterium]
MPTTTRRSFLAGAAAAGVLATSVRSRAAGANERVRVAIIGAGNQGKSHARSLLSLSDVEIAYVCDVDQQRLGEQLQRVGGRAQAVADLRRVLDDPSVDAVTLPIPDHWHAPAALLALDAGKHIYVEKPCSHNVREGRMLLDAAVRHGKVAAHGTQSRSVPGMQEAIGMLHEGVIGDVLIARCWNWQMRKNIGRAQPSAPPPHVDYDSWVGPAEWLPYQENRFHYDWHWWYNFGTGDVGNDGCHEFDIALWGLGVTEHPTHVAAAGGKYFFDDDQQFPDTAQVALEWPGDGKPGGKRMLIYEQRLWSTNYPFGVDSGNEFIGTKGRMFVSKRGKFELRGERNAPIDRQLHADTKAEVAFNHRNWIDCIKSGQTPNASIDVAHRTATAAHLGNIAIRLGRSLRFDPQTESFPLDADATALLSRSYRAEGHWAIPKAV